MDTRQLTTSLKRCRRSIKMASWSCIFSTASSTLASPSCSSPKPMVRRIFGAGSPLSSTTTVTSLSITEGVTCGAFSRNVVHSSSVSNSCDSLACMFSRDTCRLAVSLIFSVVFWLYCCSMAVYSCSSATRSWMSISRAVSSAPTCCWNFTILDSSCASTQLAMVAATRLSTLVLSRSAENLLCTRLASSRASWSSLQMPPTCRSKTSTTVWPWRMASSSGVPPMLSTGLMATGLAKGRSACVWQVRRK
mmetsp:Transcript_39827/g.112992  ORF Transcript_39827/g.112992 Transcript_39827/m.112992 type:complete len:249 (-) Transcript_39827:2497-3243(-)